VKAFGVSSQATGAVASSPTSAMHKASSKQTHGIAPRNRDCVAGESAPESCGRSDSDGWMSGTVRAHTHRFKLRFATLTP
jgi:hypothetical protein